MKALCVLLLVATSAAGQCQDGWCPQPQYYTPPQRQPQRQPQVAPEYEPRPNVTENPPPAKPPSELKPCECGPKWTELTAWQARIAADFAAKLKERDTLIAELSAKLESQATALAKVENNVSVMQQAPAVTPHTVPTPEELAAEVAKHLTHSATIQLLDGTTKTQTKPLSEPLEFIQHSRGLR